MISRKNCLFGNEKILTTIKELKQELYLDFRENQLDPCESCNFHMDREASENMHNKVLHLYNTLSEILFKLDELSTTTK